MSEKVNWSFDLVFIPSQGPVLFWQEKKVEGNKNRIGNE
jgi:hypothetical protein